MAAIQSQLVTNCGAIGSSAVDGFNKAFFGFTNENPQGYFHEQISELLERRVQDLGVFEVIVFLSDIPLHEDVEILTRM